MQSFTSLSDQSDAPPLYDHLMKLDRILRLFRNCKVLDDKMKGEAEKRAYKIVEQMRSTNPSKLQEIEERVVSIISEAFSASTQNNGKKNGTSRVQSQSNSFFGSEKNSKLAKKKQSIDSKQDSLKSIGNSNPNSSANSFNSLPQEKTFKFPIMPTSGANLNIMPKREDSCDISESSSKKDTLYLKEYCRENQDELEDKFCMNENVFEHVKEISEDNVILLGVQKPRDYNDEKLYLSTVMKFKKEEVSALKMNRSMYIKEIEEFESVIRFPIGLLVPAKSIDEIKVQHWKFLLEMTSPQPIIIVFNIAKPEQSLFLILTNKGRHELDIVSMIEIGKIAPLFKENNDLFSISQFKKIAIKKDNSVTTKFLDRNEENKTIENKKAIYIEKKIQRKDLNGEFKFKVHNKFLTNLPKEQFYVYLVNADYELSQRRKMSSLREAAMFVNESSENCLISFTIKTEKQISRENFEAIFSCREKSPIFAVRLKTLSLHKVAFLTFKPNITETEIKERTYKFKDLELNANNLFDLIVVISKANIKEFQTENPIEE